MVNYCITNSLILEVFYVNYTGTLEGEREKPSNIHLQSIMTRKLALWEGLSCVQLGDHHQNMLGISSYT